jgi:hypothetical protein
MSLLLYSLKGPKIPFDRLQTWMITLFVVEATGWRKGISLCEPDQRCLYSMISTQLAAEAMLREHCKSVFVANYLD